MCRFSDPTSMKGVVYQISNVFEHRSFSFKEHLPDHYSIGNSVRSKRNMQNKGQEITSFVQKRSDEGLNWRNGISHEPGKVP